MVLRFASDGIKIRIKVFPPKKIIKNYWLSIVKCDPFTDSCIHNANFTINLSVIERFIKSRSHNPTFTKKLFGFENITTIGFEI